MATTTTPFVTRYDQRVQIVKDVLLTNKALDDAAAADLAVKVLRVLDGVSEKIR